MTRFLRVGFSRVSARRRGSDGIALITTLLLLAVLSGLVVAMLTVSRLDARLAANSERNLDVRSLAHLPESLAIAQLREATETPGRMWASQPGALRTYGLDGDFLAGFKLYSDGDMIVGDENSNGIGDEIAFDTPPADWDAKAVRYVDLNEPVLRDIDGDGQVETFFPIADPRSRPDPAGAATQPFAGEIEGFDFQDNAIHGVGGEEELAMPVEWIYVLEDGGLGVLDDQGNFLAFDSARDATEENPIMGRVAFWADDESSKLNLNTIGEPTPWDVPRADNNKDRAYASYQPATREFQRFPGHPATTAISGLINGGSSPFSASQKEVIYGVLPRLAPGGSIAGTKPTDPVEITIGRERLFPSPDELVFRPDRSTLATALGIGGLDDTILAQWTERVRFFLTTHSRSPEITRYGTPRICMWPTAREAKTGSGQARRTAFDELIRFCATVGGKAYHLERHDADSPTHDYEQIERNQELFEYLRHLTGLASPGGGTFLAKYGEDDRIQILVSMLDYIRSTNLYDSTLEWPGAFSGTDPADMPPPEIAEEAQFTDARYILPLRLLQDGDPECWEVGMTPGHGQVAPLQVRPKGSTKTYNGFGRFHTISEIGLHFICTAAGDQGPNRGGYGDPGGKFGSWRGRNHYSNIPPGANPGDSFWAPLAAQGIDVGDEKVQNKTLENSRRLKHDERRVQMALVLEYFSPMQGDTGIYDDITVRISGIDPGEFQLEGTTLGLPADEWSPTVQAMGNTWHERMWGGGMGYRGFLAYKKAPARPPLEEDTGYSDENKYPFVSNPVTVKSNRPMSFTGGTCTISLYSGNEGPLPARHIQDIEVRIPDGQFPVPDLVRWGWDAGWRAGWSATNMQGHRPIPPTYFWSFHADGAVHNELSDMRWFLDEANPRNLAGGSTENAGRLRGVTRSPDANEAQGRWLHHLDTIRTLHPRHGDHRLVAGLHSVPAGVFVPHADYANPGIRPAHNLWNTAWQHNPRWGSNSPNYRPDQQLVPTGYNWDSWPDLPINVVAQTPVRQTGDFDNGIALVRDGAYINKPDEGNALRDRGIESRVPYFDTNWWSQAVGPSFFSPNRMIPSAGMFGSLPTRMHRDLTTGSDSWTTLLLRPQTGHPGAETPADHWLLDLFWMPVVEPYALSEPFSTAGKINLNSAIAPFSYLRRDGGLRAALKSEEILTIPTSEGGRYKYGPRMPDARHPIDLDATLSQLEQRFVQGRLFRGASEICELHLVPDHPSIPAALTPAQRVARMTFLWATNKLTGDNSRERPYANLYPRLATRSNVFRVHHRVQVLRRPSGADPGRVMAEDINAVAEHRGSTLIERYIDPAHPDLPDHAALFSAGATDADPLDRFYRFRTISSSRFDP